METIFICSAKGGVGKTTTARGLADHLAPDRRCLLVDLNPDMGLTRLLMAEFGESAVTGGTSVASAVEAYIADEKVWGDPAELRSGFWVLPAGTRLAAVMNQVPWHKGSWGEELIAWAAGAVDTIIIDTRPGLDFFSASVAKACSLRLGVTTGEILPVQGVIDAHLQLKGAGAPLSAVVWNRMTLQRPERAVQCAARSLLRSAAPELKALRTEIPERTRIARAWTMGAQSDVTIQAAFEPLADELGLAEPVKAAQ